jgi:hypothetical protein
VFERSEEVVGSGIAADVAIDTSRIDVEGAVSVFFNFVVSVRHESADYADFTDQTNRSKGADEGTVVWGSPNLIGLDGNR